MGCNASYKPEPVSSSSVIGTPKITVIISVIIKIIMGLNNVMHSNTTLVLILVVCMTWHRRQSNVNAHLYSATIDLAMGWYPYRSVLLYGLCAISVVLLLPKKPHWIIWVSYGAWINFKLKANSSSSSISSNSSSSSSSSSSNFIPNGTQQYYTVYMTNIRNSRVILDIVMWFYRWPPEKPWAYEAGSDDNQITKTSKKARLHQYNINNYPSYCFWSTFYRIYSLA